MNKFCVACFAIIIYFFSTAIAQAGFYVGNAGGITSSKYNGPVRANGGKLGGSVASSKTRKRTFYSFTLRSGSLRSNLQRILQKAHWGTLVWTLPYDYKWTGTARVSSNTLQGVFEKVLHGYPVQAVFYEQNRIVAITPRPITAYKRKTDMSQPDDKISEKTLLNVGVGVGPDA